MSESRHNIKIWQQEEEKKLIEVWKDHISELRSARRNSHIYHAMAENLRQLGVVANPKEIQRKVNNLTQRYRKEKDAMGKMGGSPSLWKHYKAVHTIISGCAFNNSITRESIDENISLDQMEISIVDVHSNEKDAVQTCDPLAPASSIDTAASSSAFTNSYFNFYSESRHNIKIWQQKEEKKLIEVWKDHISELRSARRNRHIYHAMAENLRQLGVVANPKEIQRKVNNLTQRYRKEKDAMGKMGGSPSLWKHYKAVHAIISGCAFNNSITRESIDENTSLDQMEMSIVDAHSNEEDAVQTCDPLSPASSIDTAASSSAFTNSYSNFYSESRHNIKIWQQKEEKKLIEVWKDHISELRSARRNSHVYHAMAENLQQLGVVANPKEIQRKVNNLTQRYRKEKDAMGKMGGSPSLWKHYKAVHAIISGCAFNNSITRESIDENIFLDQMEISVVDAHSNEEDAVQTCDPLAPASSIDTAVSSSAASNNIPVAADTETAAGSEFAIPSTSASKKKTRGSINDKVSKELQNTNTILQQHCEETTELLKQCVENDKEIVSLMRSFLSAYTSNNTVDNTK